MSIRKIYSRVPNKQFYCCDSLHHLCHILAVKQFGKKRGELTVAKNFCLRKNSKRMLQKIGEKKLRLWPFRNQWRSKVHPFDPNRYEAIKEMLNSKVDLLDEKKQHQGGQKGLQSKFENSLGLQFWPSMHYTIFRAVKSTLPDKTFVLQLKRYDYQVGSNTS